MKNVYFKTIMLKGEAGSTISKIELTSSVYNVDTYTIYLNDGSTQTFEVTNGTSINSIEKTATAGYVDTYTITLTNGETFTFEVQNGEDGSGYEVPVDSVIYFDSDDAIPEGYEAATNPERSRVPFSIYMDNVSAAFTSGAATISLSSLGLTGATIQAVQATPNYVSALNAANCFCTCQIYASGINVYIRDAINNTVPADATYSIALFVAYS